MLGILSIPKKKKKKKKIDPEDDPKNIILSEGVKTEKEEEFTRGIEGALIEALNESERLKNLAKFPPWLIVLIAYLGFDDFLSWIRNPFLMMFVITLGAGVYAIYALNLWGPLKFLLQNVLQQVAAQSPALQSIVNSILQLLGMRPVDTNQQNQPRDMETSKHSGKT